MPQGPPPGPYTTPWAICDGLFTMPVPSDWHYRPQGYTDGAFDLSGGQSLSCHIESFEVPEAIANGGLMDFVREPGLDIPPLEDAEITGNVLMFIHSPTRAEQPATVWKSVDILDNTHIRVARFSMPRDTAIDGTRSPENGVSGDVTLAVNQGRFADRATPLDRVAPTNGLKRIAPWGVILMRVPEWWRYERAEDGRYVCDVLPEQAPPDPTLWLDFNQFGTPQGETRIVEQVHQIAAGLPATLESSDHVRVDHDEVGSWVASVTHGNEGGTPLVFHNIQRFVAGNAGMVVAHFNFVLPVDDSRTPAGQELTELIHREIRNAIVLPEPYDE